MSRMEAGYPLIEININKGLKESAPKGRGFVGAPIGGPALRSCTIRTAPTNQGSIAPSDFLFSPDILRICGSSLGPSPPYPHSSLSPRNDSPSKAFSSIPDTAGIASSLSALSTAQGNLKSTASREPIPLGAHDHVARSVPAPHSSKTLISHARSLQPPPVHHIPKSCNDILAPA